MGPTPQSKHPSGNRTGGNRSFGRFPPATELVCTRVQNRHYQRWYVSGKTLENSFAKIKEFRAIATRYDKTDESFAAGIHLVAGVLAAK